jgi:hypothetical protein
VGPGGGVSQGSVVAEFAVVVVVGMGVVVVDVVGVIVRILDSSAAEIVASKIKAPNTRKAKTKIITLYECVCRHNGLH